jgi:hypothetical protein
MERFKLHGAYAERRPSNLVKKEGKTLPGNIHLELNSEDQMALRGLEDDTSATR